MTKKTKTQETQPDMDKDVDSRSRPKRKVTYVEQRVTEIPQDVIEAFAKDDWVLRFIRYSFDGDVDVKNLSKREREGWEFVTAKDLKEKGVEYYLSSFDQEDTRSFKGLLVNSDVVLAKADVNLVASRNEAMRQRAAREQAAADAFTKGRKPGFVDFGSSSKVTHSEPQFQS